MKNGLHSKNLVLVNSNGQPLTGQDLGDDVTFTYGYESESGASSPQIVDINPRQTLFIFMAISIACTTAAVATGTYAIWLARHQATQKALTDVNDLLKTCKMRMEQLEADVQNLPRRA